MKHAERASFKSAAQALTKWAGPLLVLSSLALGGCAMTVQDKDFGVRTFPHEGASVETVKQDLYTLQGYDNPVASFYGPNVHKMTVYLGARDKPAAGKIDFRVTKGGFEGTGPFLLGGRVPAQIRLVGHKEGNRIIIDTAVMRTENTETVLYDTEADRTPLSKICANVYNKVAHTLGFGATPKHKRAARSAPHASPQNVQPVQPSKLQRTATENKTPVAPKERKKQEAAQGTAGSSPLPKIDPNTFQNPGF